MSTTKLIDRPLNADEIRIVMSRAVEVARAAGHTWVTEADMLTHRDPGPEGSRLEDRLVNAYSLAFKLPRHGVRLDAALELALFVSGLLGGPGAEACRLEYNELWFGRFSPAQLRQL